MDSKSVKLMTYINMALLLLTSLVVLASGCTKLSTYWSTVEKLVEQMTLKEKIGQMTQADAPQLLSNDVVNSTKIDEYKLGSILIGGNGVPDSEGHIFSDRYKYPEMFLNGTIENWKDFASRLNKPIKVGEFSIYPLLGTDAVHGNQHVVGQPLFPHNIGMSCSHNPANFYNAGFHTQASVKATGWNFAFAPTVAVSHNFFWGRHYETMGAEYEHIDKYAKQYALGLQQDNGNGLEGVLSSVKHFIGDGATFHGIDEGNDTVSNFANFLEVNYRGYAGGKSACMGNVMVSYSAINNIAMSINGALIDGVLKNGIYDGVPFEGFAISDYDAIGKVANQGWPTTNIHMSVFDSMVNIINAGVDMLMLASTNGQITPEFFQSNVMEALDSGAIKMERINDAVKRILGVKCAMGLIEGMEGCPKPQSAKAEPSTAIEDALQAAKESLVLLKNDDTLLPVDLSSLKYVVLTGERDVAQRYESGADISTTYRDYDNIGAQCGGWTIAWQGYNGNYFWEGANKNSSGAYSILDALKKRMPSGTTIIYNTYQNATNQVEIEQVRNATLKKISEATDMTSSNTLILGVISESPYAEFMGDINNPFCQYSSSGCMYYGKWVNPYLPDRQKTSLEINYESNSMDVIKAVRNKSKGIPLVSVLFSGRPMMIEDSLEMSDAFIAAWLPGTTGGEAIVSAITGEYLFKNNSTDGLTGTTNTLSVDWIKNQTSLSNYPIYEAGDKLPKISDPLFEMGFGIKTHGNADPNNDDFSYYSFSLFLVLILLI